MKSELGFACSVLAIAFSTSAAAVTSFSDSTFNIADYTITKSLQAGTATVSQSATGGNPGSAMEVDYVVPPGPAFTNTFGNVYFIDNAFTYDTGASGALTSISWSIDKKVSIVRPTNLSLVNSQTFLISQGGSFYAAAVAVPGVIGTYITSSLTTLFSDFSLVTDMATGAVNSALHPSFSAGAMAFGFRNGYGIGPQIDLEVLVFQDNFNVTLTPAVAPVPEPGTYALMLAGLGVLAWSSRRRAQA